MTPPWISNRLCEVLRQQRASLRARGTHGEHIIRLVQQKRPSGESESGPLVTVEAPEVPDADGLTSSEFRLVAAQAQDPHLDPKERAEAALLMPFGTRGKLDTCVVVSCATSELTLCRIYRSLCSRVISSSKCTFCTYNDVSNS